MYVCVGHIFSFYRRSSVAGELVFTVGVFSGFGLSGVKQVAFFQLRIMKRVELSLT